MDIHQARAETVQEGIITKMDTHQERMGTSINAWQKEMMACQEATEACLESKEPTSGEIESVAVHGEVPKEEGAVKTVRARKKWYGDPAPSCNVPPTAEKMDPGQYWVPEEVVRCPQRDDSPCHSCTA
jgi:hypothetical protein